MSIKEAIVTLVDGRSLSADQAAAAMTDIFAGRASDAQIGAFATALRMKGETAEEIAGLAGVMRGHALRVEAGDGLVDVVGTGGDGSNTFNVSTTAALVVAAAGGRVAKHGNRAITSGCGSADVLEGLGFAIDLAPAGVAACVAETGFGFMFAPVFHPALKHAAAARKDIGIRTVFNILGPLTNPAFVQRIVIGSAVGPLAGKLAMVLTLMGTQHGLVVHGCGGLDELSLSGPSQVFEVHGEDVTSFEVGPDRFGLTEAPLSAIQGGTLAANLALTAAALGGSPSPARDVVALNAGAGLYVAGLTDTIKEGVDLALETISSGRARAKLDQVREVSQRLRRAGQAAGA